MRQDAKTIYSFKKGDIITRLEPMIDEEGYKDFSLVGAKLVFLGIANACAYLSRKANPLVKMFLGQDIEQLRYPLDLCMEGWADYREPDFLEGEGPIELTDEQTLEEEIKKSVAKEDYFKAEALKKKLEEIRNKKK